MPPRRRPTATPRSEPRRAPRIEPARSPRVEPAPSPAPPLARDPWALAALLAIAPLLAKCWGAPLGEPAAEDYDFLHRIVFHGLGSLLDGGGSTAFWRPLAHQVYYAALGRFALTHPLAVALVHAALLAAGTLLLYRAFRTSLSGAVAASAAAFPLFAESTRTLIGWPTQFVDVGLFVFSAIAIHEASRRRLWSTLAALLAALLCKELALITAALVPLLPGPAQRGRRRAWAGAIAGVVAAWAAAYLAVRHAAHLVLPHGIESDPSVATVGPVAKVAWALAGSLRSLTSLPLVHDPRELPALLFGVALVLAIAVAAATSAAVRARLTARREWLLWGTAWFALCTAALGSIYPLWQPNRAHVGSVGAGVVLAAAAESVHPALLAGLVGGRTLLLALAPHAARAASPAAPESGAFIDFAKLTRLQSTLREARAVLATVPPPPHGSAIVFGNAPRATLYALGGDHAVQVWFRDSTLHAISATQFSNDQAQPVAAFVQFQAAAEREVVLVPVAALREQEHAYTALLHGDLQGVLASVDRSDSLAPDPHAAVFHAGTAGFRALTLYGLSRFDPAVAEARRALALDPSETNARITLAV